MTVWVLLLRAINVGGHGKLPMADLRMILEGLGARQVATYIQSGNVVLSGDIDPPTFLEAMWAQIEADHGFRRDALLLPAAEFRAILAAYPFDIDAPKAAHIWFHTTAPSPDHEKIAALRAVDEQIKVTPAATYLYAPRGIGRSKLAARLEPALGVAATARNMNTAQKLLAMLASEFPLP